MADYGDEALRLTFDQVESLREVLDAAESYVDHLRTFVAEATQEEADRIEAAIRKLDRSL